MWDTLRAAVRHRGTRSIQQAGTHSVMADDPGAVRGADSRDSGRTGRAAEHSFKPDARESDLVLSFCVSLLFLVYLPFRVPFPSPSAHRTAPVPPRVQGNTRPSPCALGST